MEEVRPSHVKMRCKCILDERLKQYLLAMASGVGLGCCCCGWTEIVQQLEFNLEPAALPDSSATEGCLRFCESHEEEARRLSLAEARDLLELQQVTPNFRIWNNGRREIGAKLPPQPAEIFRQKLPESSAGLFVGDLDDVSAVARLKDLGIGFVLNLCPDQLTGAYAAVPASLAQSGIVHLAWPARDHWRFDIVAKVVDRGALDFIEAGLRCGKGVLVNCYGGVNRSAAVAVAFLVIRRQQPLRCAVERAMERRGTVLTQQYFRFLLVRASRRDEPRTPLVEDASTRLSPVLFSSHKRASSADSDWVLKQRKEN